MDLLIFISWGLAFAVFMELAVILGVLTYPRVIAEWKIRKKQLRAKFF